MPCGSSKDSCHQDKNGENGHCGFEDLDHSVLQQPLNLGVTNVKQILKCIQSGSREVKDIILNECNIIYECKACLGLFRSLANFLYHKRCYCKKHLCEEMVLFENFEEAEPIVIQPEAPPETTEVPMETSTEPTKLVDCTVNLVKTDIAQEMNCVPKGENSKSESVGDLKEKTVATHNDKVKGKSELPVKTESSMISRRTRDKNAQSTSKITLKAISSEEPPVKCAKIISAKLIKKDSSEKAASTGTRKDNQPVAINKEAKMKKIEISKFTSTLDKSIPSFPKIIFKSIDSNPHAVFQSNDKKKFDSFVNRYETHEAKVVDNEKLIIVLKKDVKPENEASSKPSESNKSEMEKLSDFHLTRRKRLMSRNDCNVYELKCLTCKTQFMSLKTLYFHMLSLHSKKRLYYPCPFCKTLFVQMYGVTRHLISIHNKTKEQINKLRDVIKKKSVWKRIDDVNPSNDMNVSPVNYQIKTDTQPETPKAVETPAETPKTVDSESGEADSLKTVIRFGKNVTLHQCAKCNRVFGRKSSQVSHQKFCIMSVKTEVTDATSLPQQTSPPVVSFLSLPQKAPATPVKSPSVFQINRPENTQVIRAPELKESHSDIKISIRPKRGAEKQMHKDFVNSQTLKWRSANRVDTNINSKTPSPIKKTNGKNLEKKVLSIMDPETLTCLKCDKKFSSYSNLRRHVAIHVGWTRFKCKYCDYQAYNKSQCWAHIQKTHSVDDDDMEKSIVNLVNNNSAISSKKPPLPLQSTPGSSKKATEISVKSSNSKSNGLAKVKISKKKNVNSSKNDVSEKKQIQAPPKKELLEGKKEVHSEYEKETAEIKKEKSQPPIPVARISKKDITDVKKEKLQTTISIQKFPKKEMIESKKEKPQATISIQKFHKKEMLENKKEKPQATISIQKFPKKEMLENKKEKPQHIIPIQKLTLPDYKRETNYKSVTTSNPTTIILSKKIPSSTVQSIVTISSDSMSSPSKISPIRTSPRKNEIKGSEEKLITTLVTRASPNTKITPIQIKLPERSNSVEEISQDSTDKNCSKKERLISEWFPKKDLSSSTIRRDSAPLIIGLVPASNAGVNARAKNSAIPFEKNSS